MVTTQNRLAGNGRRKAIDVLRDPVGVIIVDGQARIAHFDRTRPLATIVILKKTPSGTRLACEVGLKAHRPYRRPKYFPQLHREAELSHSEWQVVLPSLFQLLRAWVIEGTAHWSETATFTYRNGWATWVDRQTMRSKNYPSRSRYQRLRFLRFSVSHADVPLLSLCTEFDYLRIAHSRGQHLSDTITAAMHTGKYSLIPGIIMNFLRDCDIGTYQGGALKLREKDLELLTLLMRPMPVNTQTAVFNALYRSRMISRGQVYSCQNLLAGGFLTRIERKAYELLNGHVVVLQDTWLKRGYTVFRYSLDRLQRVTS